MLNTLEIHNFALIDALSITFSKGLNIFTGETGAGKSIVIEALGFVLGARGDTGLIKEGTTKMYVKANFENINIPSQLEQKYKVKNTLTLERTLDKNGKNTIKINNMSFGVQALADLGAYLMDFHGQHEHQSLFNPMQHLSLLDTFAKDETLLKQVEICYQEYKKLKEQLQATNLSKEEKSRLLDLYSYQVKEIENANLKEGEEEDLLKKLPTLKYSGNLKELAQKINDLLNEDNTACELLNKASQILSEMAETDKSLEPLAKELGECSSQVQEISSTLTNYAESIDVDPQVLDNLLTRQEEIKKIKQKYGTTLEDVFKKCKELKDKVNILQNSEENTKNLTLALEKQAQKLLDFNKGLHSVRQKASKDLSVLVIKEITPLGFEGVRFETSLELLEEPTPKGIDKAEFLFSANAGQSLRPLRNIASGGEIARLMLGLKTILAGQVPTMVFDEVDTGISGNTAKLVGKKLKNLAQNKQVLCVTHLAQVAVFADKHFKVEKTALNGQTNIKVHALQTKEIETEIARILGSINTQSAGFKHACELLTEAREVFKEKENICPKKIKK